jgi:transposase InsO family protein
LEVRERYDYGYVVVAFIFEQPQLPTRIRSRNLTDEKDKIEQWRHAYNHDHPHSSLNMQTPKEFAEK